MRAYLPDYDLVRPESLEDALQLLGSGGGWRPISGGTDLMVLLNAGRLDYRRLISVRSIPELRQIRASNSYLEIGAAVTYTQIRESDEVRTEFPMLYEAAASTGGIANQNRGTLGGNVVNASPAADSAPPLLAYGAELMLASNTGTRILRYRDFHTGYKQINMKPEELLVSIRLPRPVEPRQQQFRKVGTRRAQAIAKVSLAAVAQVKNGLVRNIALAFGSVAPYPLHCERTENLLAGKQLTPDRIAEAVALLESEIRPISDIRSTSDYRLRVSRNLLREFLESLA